MRRRESSTLSNILFSLFIFLFISEVQARKQEQVCSSSCGDIKNITYPFHLKGDPVGCGEPNFELTCESNRTILQSGSGKYYVKEIFYDDRTIRVVDVNLANGSCGALPSRPLSLYETLNYDDRDKMGLVIEDVSFTGRKVGYYTETEFLNCSGYFGPPAYKRVPCLSPNQSYFVNYRDRSKSYGQESCSVISSVPTLVPFETNPTYETIHKLLQSGFDLRWFHRSCYPYRGYGSIVDDSGLIHRTIWFYCYNKSFAGSLFSLGRYMFATFLSLFQFGSGYYLEIWTEYTFDLLLVCFLLAVLTVRFIIAPITLFVYIIHKYKRKWKTVDNVEKFLHNQESWMPKRYSYYEIIAMTNHFSYELGQGGFGSVYKGQLHSGCLIAVKVLKNSKFSAEEFINEVSTMGRIHHVNIVQLLGYCFEGPKRALVYEYMSNGSLDKHIFSRGGSSKLFSWEKLHEIALGTARGIEYLHGGCDVCILHFDIKPHNILLDHNFVPKVSDFGLAKFCPKENDFVSISATRGTIGYIAPELISRNFGVVSCKSDVYSFGMLLLEMAGGRRNSFLKETRSSKAYFPSWVYDRIHEGGDLEIHDVSENEIGIARKLCVVGLWCIQVNAADRPSITKVREMLEGSIDDLQMPPKPFFSSSQHISARDHIQIESDSSAELLLSESMKESLYIDSNV